MWNVGDDVLDWIGGLGWGKVIDIYTNRHDDPNGITMYIVDFGNDQVFDRMGGELR